MEHAVELFLERQRRSDSRTAVFVINGDIEALSTLVKEAADVDSGKTAEIINTDSVDTDTIADLYLIAHTYRATYLGAIVAQIVRIPHPTVAAAVESLDSAMEFCQWEHVAWLANRCYRYGEIKMVFKLARHPDAAKALMNVCMDVYNCMPMAWALDKAMAE